MHFSALRGINRIAWGTWLVLTAVLARPVDCTSSGPILKTQHCCLSPNGYFTHLPNCPRLPPTPPIDSIRDITGTEKIYPKKPAAFKYVACRNSYEMIAIYNNTIYIPNIPGVTVLYHKRRTVHSIF